MHAVQFGRWIAERRSTRGWPSQQALVDAVVAATSSFPRQPAITGSRDAAGISRPFLARLEAGLLAHPFKGASRQRVMALAAFLCTTPRQVLDYLQAAEITELSPDETAQVERLIALIRARDARAPLILPARPRRLIGRDAALEELMAGVAALSSGCCAISGMPGIGKTALAAEVLYRLAAQRSHGVSVFHDGIATFTCTGRRGALGLLSLIEEVVATFTPAVRQRQQTDASQWMASAGRYISPGTAASATLDPAAGWSEGTDAACASSSSEAECEVALARAGNHARAVLAGRRLLLLLDDVEASFPLRRALGILSEGGGNAWEAADRGPGPVVLITSRTIPLPALVDLHLHLAPLDSDAGVALLEGLLADPLQDDDVAAARRLCAAAGNVPLAIETLAAVAAWNVPLAWLVEQTAHSMRTILDDVEAELRTALESAVTAAPEKARRQFALLSMLASGGADGEDGDGMRDGTAGAASFDLEAATALHRALTGQGAGRHTLHREDGAAPLRGRIAGMNGFTGDGAIAGSARNRGLEPLERAPGAVMELAAAAATMHQLVRHSVVEAITDEAVPDMVAVPAGAAGSTGGIGRRTDMRVVPATFAAMSSARAVHAPTARRAGRRYALNPLFAALAADWAQKLDEGLIERAAENLGDLALEYMQRNQWDIRALELERPMLLSATHRTIERGDDERTVRLVGGLYLLLMRMPDAQAGNQYLAQGIAAAQRSGDTAHVAQFFNLLGNLCYSRGDVQQAERNWHASLQATETVAHAEYPWIALYNLSLLARLRGDYPAAAEFAERYYRHVAVSEQPFDIAMGLHYRGLVARLMGKADAAHDDQMRAAKLLNAIGARDMPGPRRLHLLEVEIELARLEGRYARSAQRLEEAVEVIATTYDRFTAVELLLDQVVFASGEGVRDDAVELARRAQDLSIQLHAPFLAQRSRDLLRNLLASSSA